MPQSDAKIPIQHFDDGDTMLTTLDIDPKLLDRRLESGLVAATGLIIAEFLQEVRNRSHPEELTATLAGLPYLGATKEAWTRAGQLAFELHQREGRHPSDRLPRCRSGPGARPPGVHVGQALSASTQPGPSTDQRCRWVHGNSGHGTTGLYPWAASLGKDASWSARMAPDPIPPHGGL